MRNDKNLSKYLSLILRHKPETIGLELDENGWGDVSFLLSKIEDLSMDRLETIVKEDNKRRYSFNEDKTKIRANQGHSVDVDLKLTSKTPPTILYHGTSAKNEISILEDGLRKMQRQHVHLSADFETAKIVAGRRKGKTVILRILASEMYAEGYEFYCSENGVWLTDYVPGNFVEVIGYCEMYKPNNVRVAQMENRKFSEVKP